MLECLGLQKDVQPAFVGRKYSKLVSSLIAIWVVVKCELLQSVRSPVSFIEILFVFTADKGKLNS